MCEIKVNKHSFKEHIQSSRIMWMWLSNHCFLDHSLPGLSSSYPTATAIALCYPFPNGRNDSSLLWSHLVICSWTLMCPPLCISWFVDFVNLPFLWLLPKHRGIHTDDMLQTLTRHWRNLYWGSAVVRTSVIWIPEDLASLVLMAESIIHPDTICYSALKA